MIRLNRLIESDQEHDNLLEIDLAHRQKCRFRASLQDGRAVEVFVPRGTVLQDGDLLAANCGLKVRVIAAAEWLSVCAVQDALAFAKACYHLGNRHVPLQIHAGVLKFQHDHVLDDMLRGFGLTVKREMAPFQPENGAYSGGHAHGHAHGHSAQNAAQTSAHKPTGGAHAHSHR